MLKESHGFLIYSVFAVVSSLVAVVGDYTICCCLLPGELGITSTGCRRQWKVDRFALKRKLSRPSFQDLEIESNLSK